MAAASRIGFALGPFGIHVDQAHCGCAVAFLELPRGGIGAGVAFVGAEPLLFLAEDDLLRLPDVGPAEAEAEGLEAGRFQRHVACVHQQVSPGDLVAVLLLDRPEQPACLVEVGVVRPAVQRREALHALPTAAAAVEDAVRTGGVPAHADEQAGVAAVVGGPPVLRGGYRRHDIGLEGLDVELGEFLGVVEVLAVRVRHRTLRVQLRYVDLIGPPVLVGQRSARLRLRRIDYRIFALASAARRWLLRERWLGVGCIRHDIPSIGF